MSLGSCDEVSITTGNRLRPGCERIHFNTSSPVFVGSLISNNTQLKCAEGRCSAAMAWSPSPATSISTGMPTFLKANPTKVTSSALSSTCKILLPIGHRTCRRQLKPEPAALAGLGFQTRVAPHPFGPFSHHRQADAGSWVLFGGVQPLEQAENLVVILASDTYAVILNPNPDETR